MIVRVSAYIFIVLTGLAVLFQLCLAGGLPWGAASMGGKFPGKYPVKMRFIAVINSLVLLFIIFIVSVRSGLILSGIYPLSKVIIWFMVVFFAAGTIMNTITPSKIERVWAPVTLVQFITSLIIALN